MRKLPLYLLTGLMTVCFYSGTSQQVLQYEMPPATSIPKSLADGIDKLIQAHADRVHSPGIVYGIVSNGKLIHFVAKGFADVEQKVKADNQTAFRIASMSKSFTAMAILQLRDAGRLHLDEPVYKYIPGLKDQKLLSGDAPAITIRNLLTHSAGFPEDNPWGDRQLAKSNEEMLAMFGKGISFSNVPGEAFEYSNMGFAMLGYIVEKVSGKPYQQFIRENIFEPLGMKSSWWEYEQVPSGRLANGYRYVNGKWNKETLLHDGAYGAMGGLLTSIDDFVKYMALHLSAWPPSGSADNGPLKRSSIREMHRPWQMVFTDGNAKDLEGKSCATTIAYAYGLVRRDNCRGLFTVEHSGGLPGFGSNWIIAPQYGLGVVCFSNVTYSPVAGLTRQVLDTLIKSLTPQRYKLLPSPILEQRKNELVKVMQNWDQAEASGIFAENFLLDYFIDTLRKQSNELFRKAGRIVKVHPVQPQNYLRGTFKVECEHSSIDVFFTLTPETPPKVQQINMKEAAKND